MKKESERDGDEAQRDGAKETCLAPRYFSSERIAISLPSLMSEPRSRRVRAERRGLVDVGSFPTTRSQEDEREEIV